MATLNSVKYSALLTNTGATLPKTLNELEILRLYQMGYTGTLQGMYHQFFDDENVPVGTLNERMCWFLINRGYSGTLNEMLYQWYSDGGGVGFCATYLVHRLEGFDIVIKFTDPATYADSQGFTVKIDGVPRDILSYDWDGATLLTLNIGETQLDDIITLSYSQVTGATNYEGQELCEFTDELVGQTAGDYAWASAGSYYILSSGNLNSAQKHHILWGQLIGVGRPAFVTPADLALPDFEGVYRVEETANVAPWHGSRVVKNLALYSQDFENAFWTKTGGNFTYGITDPNGGNTAVRIEATSTLAYIVRSGYIPTGSQYRGSWWIRRVSGVGRVQIYTGDSSSVVDVEAGLTSEWQRIAVPTTGVVSVAGNIGVLLRVDGDIVEFAFGMYEPQDGQTNQAPSAYIPTTTVPVTVKYSNLNGNTVLNNVVTEALGAPLAVMPSLFGNAAVQNSALYSRDMTQPSWTKRNGTTASYNQDGVTGEPNTATLIGNITTGGANDLYFTSGGLTPSVPVIPRIWLKAVTTDQTLRISNSTSANGQWEIDLSLLSTTEFEIITEEHPAVTVTEQFESDGLGSCGFLFANQQASAGISFILGQVELHVNKTIAQVKGSQPIFTEGAAVTQARIDMSYNVANHSDVQGAYYCELTPFLSGAEYAAGVAQLSGIISLTGAAASFLYFQSNATRYSYDGTNVLTKNAAWLADATQKIGSSYGQSESLKAFTVDGIRTEGAYDGSFEPAGIFLLRYPSSPMLIRNVRRYDLPYAEAKAKIDELMAL